MVVISGVLVIVVRRVVEVIDEVSDVEVSEVGVGVSLEDSDDMVLDSVSVDSSAVLVLVALVLVRRPVELVSSGSGSFVEVCRSLTLVSSGSGSLVEVWRPIERVNVGGEERSDMSKKK